VQNLALCRAPFRTASRNSEGEVRSPRADFLFFANPHPGGSGSPVDRHQDRSARSVLNRGSFLKAKRAKPPLAKACGKPGSGAEPSGGTGGECRKRERRKAGAPQDYAARSRAMRGYWLDNAPFGAPLPCLFAHDLVRKPQQHFSGSCAGEANLRGLVAWQSSGAEDASRERDFCVVIAGLDPAIHGNARIAKIRSTFRAPDFSMDHRVKPGGDEERRAPSPPRSLCSLAQPMLRIGVLKNGVHRTPMLSPQGRGEFSF
jgi:hypothetical protein